LSAPPFPTHVPPQTQPGEGPSDMQVDAQGELHPVSCPIDSIIKAISLVNSATELSPFRLYYIAAPPPQAPPPAVAPRFVAVPQQGGPHTATVHQISQYILNGALPPGMTRAMMLQSFETLFPVSSFLFYLPSYACIYSHVLLVGTCIDFHVLLVGTLLSEGSGYNDLPSIN
jgi:hypothetical protein